MGNSCSAAGDGSCRLAPLQSADGTQAANPFLAATRVNSFVCVGPGPEPEAAVPRQQPQSEVGFDPVSHAGAVSDQEALDKFVDTLDQHAFTRKVTDSNQLLALPVGQRAKTVGIRFAGQRGPPTPPPSPRISCDPFQLFATAPHHVQAAEKQWEKDISRKWENLSYSYRRGSLLVADAEQFTKLPS